MNAYAIVFYFILFGISANLFAGTTVYIPLGSANQVIAVDAATDKIVATYTGVENPHGLVATPDGEYLVAGSLKATSLLKPDAKAMTSKLFLIHPAHGHVMLTIPVAGESHHQAITPDGRFVLSTHTTRGYVSVVDLQSNQVVRTIKTGPAPNYIVITRDGKDAYVTNSGNGTIRHIDLATWKAGRTLSAGPGPEHLVISADQKILYVGNPRVGTISVVDIATGKIRQIFNIGPGLHGLDIGDDGYTLFASSKKSNLLVALNTRTGKKRELKLTPAPYHLNTIRGTGKVYVSSRKQPKIWVVDQKTLKVTGSISLPAGEGHQMAIVVE